jgi:hypothetical protein
LLGLSIWLAVGQDLAPFPRHEGYFTHGADFGYGPVLGLVDTEVPSDVLDHLRQFKAERQVERRISSLPDRVATAWLGDSLMLGGESIALNDDDGALRRQLGPQLHPATMHWRTPDGGLGWMRVRAPGLVSARAERKRLSITARRPASEGDDLASAAHFLLELKVPGKLTPGSLSSSRWELPGLAVNVTSDAGEVEVVDTGLVHKVIYALPAGSGQTNLQLDIL